MAHLLVGSRYARFTTRVELKLWPLIRNKVLGVCHFGSFYEAMDAAAASGEAAPDRRRTGRPHHAGAGARDRDVSAHHRTAVRGDPDAVLIVEFAEEDQAEKSGV